MIDKHLITAAIALTLSAALPQGDGPPPAADLKPSDWVTELYKGRPETLISELILPGTHDSGSYKITADSPPASGAPSLYSRFGGVAASWAKTQDKDLGQQLLDGIRYLDLRIDEYEGELVLIHGLVSCPLKAELLGVRDFAKKHPKEPVVLDIQDMPPPGAYEELDELLLELFSEHLYQAKGPPKDWSLESVWETGRSLITLSADQSFSRKGARYQHRSVLDSVWTNTRDVESLKRGLDQRISSRDRSRLQCAYLTFTPTSSTIASDSFRGRRGLRGISEKLFKLPGKWLPRWLDEGSHPNIISVDYYDKTDVVEAALAANRRLLET